MMKDNKDKLDLECSNSSSGLVRNGKIGLDCALSPEWIMHEWFVNQVKKAEKMYRRAIAETDGAVV
jgi:hypothetical protein